jgi:hypothetical protein
MTAYSQASAYLALALTQCSRGNLFTDNPVPNITSMGNDCVVTYDRTSGYGIIPNRFKEVEALVVWLCHKLKMKPTQLRRTLFLNRYKSL